MSDSSFLIKEVDDSVEVARRRAQDERAKRNSDWLQSHWSDLLPRARDNFLVVAGGQAFIADTPEAAWALACKTHPEDDGALGQYVFPREGPRIYANRWPVASL
jgi:hypothetical protein